MKTPPKNSKTERFARTFNGWKPLTIFARCSNPDVLQGSEYASDSTLHIKDCTWDCPSGDPLMMYETNLKVIQLSDIKLLVPLIE